MLVLFDNAVSNRMGNIKAYALAVRRFRLTGAEELAHKTENALACTKEAIRLHLLGPKPVDSRVYAAAA